LDLYSGGLWSALARFFLQSIGLPQNGSRSALSESPHNDFCAGPLFRSCSHSLMFRPPGLLATQVVPTDATCAHGGHDFYFRAPYGSLLPHTSDMLAVRFRAIDGRGLSPHKIRGAVGRIHRFNGLLRSESHFLGRKLFHRSSSEPIDILGHLWRPQEKPLKRFLDSGGPL
jgi:hypothetical protein